MFAKHSRACIRFVVVPLCNRSHTSKDKALPLFDFSATEKKLLCSMNLNLSLFDDAKTYQERVSQRQFIRLKWVPWCESIVLTPNSISYGVDLVGFVGSPEPNDLPVSLGEIVFRH